MSKPIVKFGDDMYLEWSSICDAPRTYIMTRAEMVEQCGDEERVKRADEFGTSLIPPRSMESLVSFNRAGENEECLSIQEIIERYAMPPEVKLLTEQSKNDSFFNR